MLWQRLLDWTRYLFKHKEQTEKNTADIKDQQQALDELTDVVQRLTFELARLRDNEAHEREKLALRLENILLRERSLPPGTARAETNIDELLRLTEELKRENEELRKRLELRDKE
jgi:cell division protein FtsB